MESNNCGITVADIGGVMSGLEIRPSGLGEEAVCAAKVVYTRRMARIAAKNSQWTRDTAARLANPLTAGAAILETAAGIMTGKAFQEALPDEGTVQLGRKIEGCAECAIGKILCQNTLDGVGFAADTGGYDSE